MIASCKNHERKQNVSERFLITALTHIQLDFTLTLSFLDVKIFAPIIFFIYNESSKNKNRGLKDKELLSQFLKNRDIITPAYFRTLEISFDKIENAISMITKAIKKRV